MINKKLIYIIFLSFFYTQNVNFDYWESKWLRAGVSSKKQEDFRNDIKLELESIDDDKYIFILTQWLLRSHYSEGKIDDSNNLVALNEYNNTVKNYYKDFTAMIYHEPYDKEMKKCNANPKIIPQMSRDREFQ